MQRLLTTSIALSIIALLLLIVTCTLPTDPSKDPNNVEVTFELMNGATRVQQGQQVEIGILVNYPLHVENINVSFGEDNIDDTLLQCATSAKKPETLVVTCTYDSAKTTMLTANVELTIGTYKLFYYTFDIYPKELTVSFDEIRKTRLLPIDEPIILNFPASTDPEGNAIDFRIDTSMISPTTTVELTDEGSNAKVVVTCTQPGLQKIICYANSSTKAYDTAEVTLIPYLQPDETDTSSDTTLVAGTTDTLLFIVPGSEKISCQPTLLDSGSYASGEVTLLSTTSDTIRVVFEPGESKTYTFNILVNCDDFTDTITYETVVSDMLTLWKQLSDTLVTAEHQKVALSLDAYLIDTAPEAIELTPSKGTISGNSLHYDVPWGSAADDFIIISAGHNEVIALFTLYLKVAPTDSSAPVIEPKDTMFSTAASAFICNFSITDSGAGIDTALASSDTGDLSSFLHTGSMYQCTVDNLLHGVPVTVTVKATDASMRKNSTTATFIITRDTTRLENVTAPLITGQPSDQTVTEGNDATFTVTATGTDLHYQWQQGTVDFDGATSATFPVALVSANLDGNAYQCVVSNSIDTVTSEVAVLTVVYTVEYDGNGNTAGTAPVDDTRYTAADAVVVEATSAAFVRTGHTLGGWSRNSDGSGNVYAENDTVVVDASDIILYARWTVDTLTVSFSTNGGSTIDDVKVPYGSILDMPADPTMTGSTFFGWYTSSSLGTEFDPTTAITVNRTLHAAWTPFYTVTYVSNGGTGSVPVDTNIYYSGDLVSILDKPSELTRPGYTFSCWNTNSSGTGTDRQTGTTYPIGSKNDTLHAKWLMVPPVITSTLSPITSYLGANDTLTVTATGIDRTYQWQKGGVDQTGATTTTLTFTPLTLADIGDYRCIVANEGGSDTTVSVRIAVYDLQLMQPVPAGGGTFSMGDGNTTNGNPVHDVTLTRNFYMDSTEVTQQQYEKVMGTAYSNFITPSWTPMATHPAYFVNWFEAILYCNALTKQSGSTDTVYTYTGRTGIPGDGCSLTNVVINYARSGFRLPTEAEWEFACRGGTDHFNYWENWSDDSTNKYTWNYANAGSEPHIVAQKGKNDYSLYDMLGNVREWCNNWYASYTAIAQTDPTGGATGINRITRGGDIMRQPDDLSSAERYTNDSPESSNKHIGFRVIVLR